MSEASNLLLVTKLNKKIKDAEYMKEDKLVKILDHLLRVNVTLDILQTTRVGVTINPLRKVNGRVGDKAKELIKKWKKLLPDQQSTTKNETLPKNKRDTENTVASSPPTIIPSPTTIRQDSSYNSSSASHDIHIQRTSSSVSTNLSPLSNSSSRNHKTAQTDTKCSQELKYSSVNNNSDANGGNCTARKRKSPMPSEVVEIVVASQTKRSRTQVYSGKSAGLKYVPSLFDTCMNILIDNIDAIDVVGGVPFFILEPVLSKCSPTQLMRLEEYNPHFIEDSDGLWEKHANKEFKGVKPSKKGMTWRDMYMRKVEERENKMKSITSIIKARQQAREEPVRKAAILNSAPLPPSRHRRGYYSRSGGTSFSSGEAPGSSMMKQTMKMAKNRHMMVSSRPRR